MRLTAEGYRIDSTITEAITKFPSPATRTDIRSFFGLANQLALSTDRMAELLEPLQPLLSTKHEFVWSATHEETLVKVKEHASGKSTNPSIL